MPPLILLASGLLIPLVAFVLIRYSRENVALMLRLLAGAGLLCGALAWLPNLAFLYPVDSGLSTYVILRSVSDTASFIAPALVAATWILALFQAVRENDGKWTAALVLSGIFAYMATVMFRYTGLVVAFGVGITISNSQFLLMGLYAITLLGGLIAFMYGAVRATPSGLPGDAEAAIDGDVISEITREPL
jgi:branched-subunit amino acid transport protein